MSKNHVILSYAFDGKGGGKEIKGDEISKKISSKQLAWVHMDVKHPGTRDWLEKEIAYLDPFIIEALLAEETRPRMTEIGDGVLLILRGVNLNENSDPEDMVSIRLWVDDHRIISVRRRKLKAISDLEDKIKNSKGPKASGEFLSMLIALLFNRISPVLTSLDELTDDAEEKVTDNPDASLRDSIVTIRKQAIMFRRYMAPQRDAITQLRSSDIKWLKDTDKRYLQENLNLITRYIEDLDAVRERAQIIKDELTTILADKLNKNMYVLSVIAAIFLPLGFLTGLLGINVGGIPGADNINAFWIFSGILLVIVAAQISVFRKLKWF